MKTAHFVGIVLAVGIVTNSEAQTTTDVPKQSLNCFPTLALFLTQRTKNTGPCVER